MINPRQSRDIPDQEAQNRSVMFWHQTLGGKRECTWLSDPDGYEARCHLRAIDLE
jgi:hypothetical protein